MKPEIIPKQETVPSFDPNAVAVKYIDYYNSSVSLQVTRQYVPKVLETKAYSVIIV